MEDAEIRNSIELVRSEGRKEVAELKKDTREAIKDIKGDTQKAVDRIEDAATISMQKESDRSKDFYGKLDAQTELINAQTRASMARKNVVDVELLKCAAKTKDALDAAEEADRKAEVTIKAADSTKKWIRGIVGTVVAGIVLGGLMLLFGWK